jgi:hypothetical protein
MISNNKVIYIIIGILIVLNIVLVVSGSSRIGPKNEGGGIGLSNRTDRLSYPFVYNKKYFVADNQSGSIKSSTITFRRDERDILLSHIEKKRINTLVIAGIVYDVELLEENLKTYTLKLQTNSKGYGFTSNTSNTSLSLLSFDSDRQLMMIGFYFPKYSANK